MPKKNTQGGKKHKRGKGNLEVQKRELEVKDVGQEYGQVTKMLGNSRLMAQCFDGTLRLCHIRGKMRKKVWVNQGDIVLVSLRDFQDEKGDVVIKYTTEEARQLKALKELPDNVKINETEVMDFASSSDDGIEFAEDEQIDMEAI